METRLELSWFIRGLIRLDPSWEIRGFSILLLMRIQTLGAFSDRIKTREKFRRVSKDLILVLLVSYFIRKLKTFNTKWCVLPEISLRSWDKSCSFVINSHNNFFMLETFLQTVVRDGTRTIHNHVAISMLETIIVSDKLQLLTYLWAAF